jgi:kynurenine formamidase
MYQLLSYPIKKSDPVWPGNPAYDFEATNEIDRGNACNTYIIHIFNHNGTHFDAPRHYNNKGPRIAELQPEKFIYEKPLILDIPKGAREKVYAEDLKPYENGIAGCDLLFIRTGFQEKRVTDEKLYCNSGPAISSECAIYLMEHFRRSLKAVALDFLSLACPEDTKDGDLAHQHMLGMFDDDGYICIIEDCNLKELPKEIKRAYAVPLMFVGIDSAPVTFVAEV